MSHRESLGEFMRDEITKRDEDMRGFRISAAGERNDGSVKYSDDECW
jgi:hypothetical protein